LTRHAISQRDTAKFDNPFTEYNAIVVFKEGTNTNNLT